MASSSVKAGASNLTRASYPQVTKIGARKRTKKLSDFDVVSEMGEGAYGKVILARYREPLENLIVIKSVYKDRILVDTWVRDMDLGTIPSEIKIMVALSEKPHENITEIIDFFEDKECYHIEMIPHGNPAIDLFDLIELQPNMPEEDCRNIFRQVVSAIKHLHDLGIAHRDIKDENIILDKQGHLKLIDFGSATYVRSGPFDVFVGTLDYASPEVLSGQPYEGKPQDIWALGILLYTITYKENPFYNVDEIMEGELRVPFVMSEKSIDLIRMILNRNVNQRPTIDNILAHPWLSTKPLIA
ncbi:Pkinase-domain-containing protein [Nadsonia fulvescens var. elongata DSM 6958]|uniref:non-specific serine/threonine protein kinase n=1 Tax=Nadsonia fulvescens var. elongata DSM 6958 TaxID=857566 RepID=A0A1E3PFS3_9ASCO|nr:Pkinase-domain-containing protein [Nadsonia fulvescens var. elongata DSM 6958]